MSHSSNELEYKADAKFDSSVTTLPLLIQAQTAIEIQNSFSDTKTITSTNPSIDPLKHPNPHPINPLQSDRNNISKYAKRKAKQKKTPNFYTRNYGYTSNLTDALVIGLEKETITQKELFKRIMNEPLDLSNYEKDPNNQSPNNLAKENG